MKIGFIFDIDRVGGGFYGGKAYALLFQIVDRNMIRNVRLYDGDTKATLSGSSRDYCIAIESSDPTFIKSAAERFFAFSDSRLKEQTERIVNETALNGEPLAFAGWIDDAGKLRDCETPWINNAWETVESRQSAPPSTPPVGVEVSVSQNAADWAWDFFKHSRK